MDAPEWVGCIAVTIIAYGFGIRRGRLWERDVWLSLWR